jgi:DNA invertase Pin-like site-specific DNA recombinase
MSSAGKLTEDSQRISLQEAGCQKIFTDDQKSKDSELNSALKTLKDGDVLVVKGFVTLGKTIKGMVEMINELHARSVCLVSIDDGVDTGTTEGRHLAHVMARLRLMDKALINERTHLSLAVGRAKGRLGGRPPALTPEQILEAKKLILAGMSVRDVAKNIGSNQATIYRLVGVNPI